MIDLDRLAAGVICGGFEGTAVDDGVRLFLHETPVAGLVLFGRNVDSLGQTRALTDAIAEVWAGDSDPHRPIVAVDQEGGRVARLRSGVEEFPPMMALAACGDLDLARRAGAQMAFDLRRAGANVDFAPVLDLALCPANTVIGARSFGDDPEEVTAYAGAFARGLDSQGIVATFKHFPGHGATAVDSHLDLPSIDLNERLLSERDLVPFARLLPDARAVMTAHIIVKSIDPANPATTSPAVLGEVLRGRCRFEGVCFTDCLQMNAIAAGVGPVEGAVRALCAGADCILISHSTDLMRECARAIASAVRQGRLDASRLQEAYDRTGRLRGRLQPALPLDAEPPDPGIGREIGRRAVTLLRGSAKADAASSVIVSFQGATTDGVQGRHSTHASLARGRAIPEVSLPLDPEASEIGAPIGQLRAMQRRPIVLMRRAHVYAGQRAAVLRLLGAFPDALIVSTREPFDALDLARARHLLCTYGDERPCIEGLGDVVFGGAPARGRLPVRMRAAHGV
jgi:beta-N-acetylhexosaminidase